MAIYSSTLADIQARVAEKLRLDASADATKTAEYVNQALAEIATVTRYFSGSGTGSALAVAASSQALPTTLVELEEIVCAYGGQSTYLRPVRFAEILMYRTGGASSGPPQVYHLRKDTVEFWPAAAGGEVLTYYGATLPEELASGPSGLPEPFNSKLLEYGACLNAAEFKDHPDREHYERSYERWLGMFLAYLNRRLTQASESVPVYGPDGRPFGATFLPHDPSSDFYSTGWRS